MVILKDSLTGEDQYVPALYVKLLADSAEWEKVKVAAATTILVISIIISGGTVLAGIAGTASAGAVTFAVIDIAVSVLDLRAIALRNVDEEKNWFDRNWDQISLGVGIATMSPILVKGILKNGPKLINAISNIGEKQIAVKNFIRSAVASAILNIEIANFSKGSFKFIPQEAVRTALTKISSSITKKLYKYNMLLATTEKGETVAVFYKGEAIITGTEKEVKEALENIFTHSRADKDILAHLDEMLNDVPFLVSRRYGKLGSVTYEVVEHSDVIMWRTINVKNPWDNKATIYGGQLDLDFNTYGVRGLGQQWTNEAFEIFGERIKTVKAEWKTNPEYPGGESLGYRQFHEAMDRLYWDEFEAVKQTTFYNTMSKKGFSEVHKCFMDSEKIIVILKK